MAVLLIGPYHCRPVGLASLPLLRSFMRGELHHGLKITTWPNTPTLCTTVSQASIFPVLYRFQKDTSRIGLTHHHNSSLAEHAEGTLRKIARQTMRIPYFGTSVPTNSLLSSTYAINPGNGPAWFNCTMAHSSTPPAIIFSTTQANLSLCRSPPEQQRLGQACITLSS